MAWHQQQLQQHRTAQLSSHRITGGVVRLDNELIAKHRGQKQLKYEHRSFLPPRTF